MATRTLSTATIAMQGRAFDDLSAAVARPSFGLLPLVAVCLLIAALGLAAGMALVG